MDFVTEHSRSLRDMGEIRTPMEIFVRKALVHQRVSVKEMPDAIETIS